MIWDVDWGSILGVTHGTRIPDYHHPIIPMFRRAGAGSMAGAGFNRRVSCPATVPNQRGTVRIGAFLFNLIVGRAGISAGRRPLRCCVGHGSSEQMAAGSFWRSHFGSRFPDSKELLTACIDGRGGSAAVAGGQLAPQARIAVRSNCDGAHSCQPDGKTVATADGRNGMRLALELPQALTQTSTTPPKESGESYSPDGKLIVTYRSLSGLEVWDARTLIGSGGTFRKSEQVERISEAVHSFAFHPSGRYLAVGGQAGPVEFVDTATWQPASRSTGSSAVVTALRSTRWHSRRPEAKGKIVVWDVDVMKRNIYPSEGVVIVFKCRKE